MIRKIGIMLSTVIIASVAFVSSAEAATTKANINFRSAPTINSSAYKVVPKGQNVEVLGYANASWFNVNYNGQLGYMSTKYVALTPQEQTGLDVIAKAKSLIGITHYKYGADQAPTLFDCSSYVKYVYSKSGISLLRDSRSQSKQGAYVAKKSLIPGDLVFFTVSDPTTIGHVGIYIGNGNMISNSTAKNGPTVASITSGYWSSRYVTARRVIQ